MEERYSRGSETFLNDTSNLAINFSKSPYSKVEGDVDIVGMEINNEKHKFKNKILKVLKINVFFIPLCINLILFIY